MKTTKVCLGLPWYSGPDEDTYNTYFEMLHYFGRLQERSHWLQYYQGTNLEDLHQELPPLDPMQADAARTEITGEDGVVEVGYAMQGGWSLPGLAREHVVDSALAWGADWLFMWDDDMLMPWSAFLRLWRHQKPVVAALAFTAREPIQPVIYRIEEKQNANGQLVHNSKFVLDYPENQLISDEHVDGPIAFGAGVVLINMNVFRQVPKPWFHSTGGGEDWMFCIRCWQHGVPRYVDTSLKTLHKMRRPSWSGEDAYEESRRERPDDYAKLAEAIQ